MQVKSACVVFFLYCSSCLRARGHSHGVNYSYLSVSYKFKYRQVFIMLFKKIKLVGRYSQSMKANRIQLYTMV